MILPIYNAEKTLDGAIQSIVNQTIGFENIELILIDDNSKDNSKEIIESYCQKYDNIIPYFSETNHGSPSFGRNIGLKLSTTDFLMFIDNDDEYDKDICKKLYDTIIAENADIVCCNKVSVDSISNIVQNVSYRNGEVFDDKVVIYDDDILFFDSITLWNKIYKKDIVNKHKLKFPENTIGDDFSFTMEYYLNSIKLVYLKDYQGYFWKISDDSLSHAITEEYLEGFFNVFLYIYEQFKNKNKLNLVNSVFKSHIMDRIGECSYLNLNFSDTKRILKKFHDFENEIGFDEKFDVMWANVINDCIRSEHYTVAILILKSIKKLRNFTLLRKINRRL